MSSPVDWFGVRSESDGLRRTPSDSVGLPDLTGLDDSVVGLAYFDKVRPESDRSPSESDRSPSESDRTYLIR